MAKTIDITEVIEIDEEQDDVQIDEYDLTSSPNDFNVITIGNFIDSGAVKIPGFQRNYVWDIKRASRLIESLIMGLPVPQVFLYEESRNSFLVIDGQQRLMSIFYFIKQRFPRKEKRGELRQIFNNESKIPDTILHDDKYFEKFSLKLTEIAPGKPNKFAGKSYATLDDYKTQFDLRTIRNVIVKQNVPKDDDSSIYAIFNRLNTGGINLTAQEIRASLYHSDFYSMLGRMNGDVRWRKFLGLSEPDLHMRDTELLLRAFAMLISGSSYGSSMTKFLNAFSKTARKFTAAQVAEYEQVLVDFLNAAQELASNAFTGKSGKFSITVFESVFSAACAGKLLDSAQVLPVLSAAAIAELKVDSTFQQHTSGGTANKANVLGRLARAKELLVSTT